MTKKVFGAGMSLYCLFATTLLHATAASPTTFPIAVVSNNVEFNSIEGNACTLNGQAIAADFTGDKVADPFLILGWFWDSIDCG